MYSQNYPVRSIADAAPDTRAQFIRRTYAHLAGAILAFIALESVLLSLQPVRDLGYKLLNSGAGWLLVLGGFMLIGWVARSFAANTASKSAQYMGLGLYIVAEAIIFVPLLLLAQWKAGQMAGTDQNALIAQAGIVTLLLVAGLTATVFITRKDFSFMRSMLMVGSFVALGLIVAGAFFGLNLGLWFSAGMVLLAAGAILYTTSNIMLHYGEDQYVSASLELFAAVALLFWYVLRIFMSRR
ncbi:Bax inhibitor-1/YccA family protein [Cerasicoccus arenae]|uniref:Permease n=1 Tax=Cerasicoccus arenae TaxID=424488 RepID=A0A8J3DG30_9BACT|nr:Bax inhibitor-1 family protein [Cerasicoccus arenae]MBK1857997.1 Bax inhibitor-1/YccA family protein [Cerasicoccus arenae]GHB97571.1 permease [Cerasicoccus arenae]